MKYKDYLTQSSAQIEESLLPHKVTQAKKQCELDISRQEEAIAGLEIALTRVKAAYPLGLAAVIQATNQLAVAKKNLTTSQTILAELF